MRPLFFDCSVFMRDQLVQVLPDYSQYLDVHLGDPDPAHLPEMLRGREVLLNGHSFMDRKLLEQLTGLKRIVFLGAGATSYIDVPAAEALGIRVETILGYGDRAVAEHSFALMMAAARQVALMDRDLRAGHWHPAEGIELGGRVLGILGFGGIGRMLAEMAQGFGMRVVFWNRSVLADTGYPQLSLDDVLAQSDVLSLHLALRPETQGFLSADKIARLKPGAIVVNTARAGLIETPALCAALKTGHIRHAGIDVFDEEPLPADAPWTGLPNVTLTSHAGYKTPEASQRLLRYALQITGIAKL